MSKVVALYHIVFCTKRREKTLPQELREEVYRFIWSEIRNHNCKLIRIGGMANHIHMLVDLNPEEKLSAFVRDIKSKTSGWLKRDGRFKAFDGWGKEYFAETVSSNAREAVVNYIKSQPEHHRLKPFAEELRELCDSIGAEYDPRQMM